MRRGDIDVEEFFPVYITQGAPGAGEGGGACGTFHGSVGQEFKKQ